MFKNLLFAFFLFISLVVYSQTKQDSISFYFNNAKGKNKLSYLKKAVILSEEFAIDSLMKKTNIKYGIQSYLTRDTVGLAFARKNLLNHYLLKKDSFSLAKVYHFDALIHRIQYNIDSSFYYYHKSKNISIQLKDSLATGRRLLSMANMQRYERDYLGSEITTIEGLKYIEPIKDYRYLNPLHVNLGLILSNLNKYKEARKYYYKAKENNKFNPSKSRREEDYLNLTSNIGQTFLNEGNYKKAITIFKEGLLFDSLKIKYPAKLELLLGNLSFTYFRQGKFDTAINGYKEVLKSREKRKNKFSQSISHTILADIYIEKKEYSLAKYHAKKGLALAKETRNTPRVLECLEHLSKVSNDKDSKEYLIAYINLKDSLFSRERSLKNQFAKVRYETEKKDKENTSLKQENTQKQLLLESEKQQKTIGWLIASASILFLAFGFTIASNRRKKLLFESKLQQVEVREKERQLIAKSLHDEVAGDIRMLHLKLAKTNQFEEAKSLDLIKENVRNLSHQLSSESFDKVSFKDQVINLVSDFFEPNFRIKVKEIDSVDWKEINNSIKRTLFLSIRESIQNSKKHAEASEINLSFNETKKGVFLTISDNGVGFNADIKKKGIGLKNIKERVESINGVFTVKSELGKGTTTKIVTQKNGK